jgi:ornithine carbamoyltransferase
MVNLKGRDLTTLRDYTSEEIQLILDVSRDLKRKLKRGEPHRLLEGKTLAMIFEGQSTRTRMSFETAMTQLGGHSIYLDPRTSWMGSIETVADAIGVINRYVDAVIARLGSQSKLEEMARVCDVPVINGSTDWYHPCQALTDFQTLLEKRGRLQNAKYVLTWTPNNLNPPAGLVNSSLYVASKLGCHFVLACPEGYEPEAEIMEKVKEDAALSSAEIEIEHDRDEAVKDADVINIYTWVTPKIFEAGMKAGHYKAKAPHLETPEKYKSWMVTQDVVNLAKPSVLVMHCMPAIRGVQVTNEVLDGPNSVIFDEAENRLHIQKAILALLIG